jgi:hypothetical protein
MGNKRADPYRADLNLHVKGAVQQKLNEPIGAITRSSGKDHYLHMERGMNGRIWLPPFAALVAAFGFFLALFIGTVAAVAQTVGPDEAVKPDGAVTEQLALTPAQKSAIYNAVLQQRVPASTTRIPVAIPVEVGAPVSPAVGLADLPDQAAADNFGPMFLKYAMVEHDVVVVDPITMRVVEIIRGNARP